jgi:hypothetical protein
MRNPIPFEAGKQWSEVKTKVFNLFFDQLTLSFDWKGRDLLFLRDLKRLRVITIESTRTLDLAPLVDCKYLESINLACKVSKKSPIDLSQVPLKTYAGVDEPELRTVYINENIETLTISNFQMNDFQELMNRNVEHITISGSKKITSLNGIQHMQNLKLVELIDCPNLIHSTLFTNGYPYLRIYIDGKLQK